MSKVLCVVALVLAVSLPAVADVLDFNDVINDGYVRLGNGGSDDFVGDSSVVFDVDDLVAEFEAETGDAANPSSRLRRRLEAIAERKRRHDDLMDFADYDLDI